MTGRLSVRLRATLTATIIVALALGGAATGLTIVLRGTLVNGVQEEAERRADEMVTNLRFGEGEPGQVDSVVEAPTGQNFATGGAYLTATRTVNTASGPVTVQARESLRAAEAALATLRNMLIFGIPALLALVAGMTWFSVGRSLGPVSAIQAKLADITARDLHRRVPVSHARDEVTALARTVNATLDRLETAVERHKRFVADAAHELRSPIATLRTRLELTGRAAPALVRESLIDVDRLQTLAADLLLLARLDAGEPLRTAHVDLGQLATEAALRPLSAKRITLDVAPDVLVQGSAGHLTRVVTNLLDNALRHADTTVSVRVTREAVLEVADDGPGIPVEHRESVFDRFARLDEARARDDGGSGLGLAIVKEIVTAHGGTVEIAPESPGTLMRVRLNRVAAASVIRMGHP